MRLDTIFPSKYLKESDLRGREVTVTISRVEAVKIGSDTKAVMYFEGKEKGLVLNKTIANTIVKLTGELDTDNWAGHRVTLFPTETEFKGEMVPCIRVRSKAPATNGQKAKAKEPEPEEWPEEEELEDAPF